MRKFPETDAPFEKKPDVAGWLMLPPLIVILLTTMLIAAAVFEPEKDSATLGMYMIPLMVKFDPLTLAAAELFCHIAKPDKPPLLGAVKVPLPPLTWTLPVELLEGI